ncbi:divalent-cation tolerance protein CutA [Gallaecimonas kandeliae]|uniref:divalent-cation tolerance protein CutA n=1 Tax=Gallaecimonas kandeliae TaxID=3029055 RepID=UPI0026474947|nr:divalent-cation tolerance protein CutA [Gallaecimonas kandeliae]WKE65030.1 divalent-cation tolerance protein CutA [Gallaecimonas kandeliae]
MTQALVVLCTCPDEGSAEALAKTLLEARLAACVNLLPGMRSLYLWQGELCDEPEVQLVIKTQAKHFDALVQLLRAHHPYDTPEILALPVVAGAPDYLAWLKEVTSPS